MLFKHLLNYSRTDYLLKQDQVLDEQSREKIVQFVERLKRHEPFQYIAGETEFYGLNFKLSPSVLIPRPETEELVQWIIKDNQEASIKILDIGTGSGCIAIALAANLPNASVYATDISTEALKQAQGNGTGNSVAVHFFESDILNWEANTFLNENHFDIIVSNPPYVRQCEKKDMMPNVLEHEPSLALFVSDEDPLIFYRRIAQYASSHLTEKGKLYYEINEYLPTEMNELLTGIGMKSVEIRKDINNRYRMARAEKA